MQSQLLPTFTTTIHQEARMILKMAESEITNSRIEGHGCEEVPNCELIGSAEIHFAVLESYTRKALLQNL